VNPTALIILVALKALKQLALLTRTTRDDQVAEIAERMISVMLEGKMPVWTAIFWALEIARHFAGRTAKTGDDKLVQEFTEVAAALERVVGKEVFRPQYADLELVIDWPYLAAPGLPADRQAGVPVGNES